MKREITLSILLVAPPAGVRFGVQKGRGRIYETLQKQTSSGLDLSFEISVELKTSGGGSFELGGPFVQGSRGERFIYIDIGGYAGQADSCWSRRLKVPLNGISPGMVHSTAVLEARIPGFAKDGGPNCGTACFERGWQARA